MTVWRETNNQQMYRKLFFTCPHVHITFHIKSVTKKLIDHRPTNETDPKAGPTVELYLGLQVQLHVEYNDIYYVIT